ncbi:hypothetical protein M0G74_14840 [Microbulbifer sp. CAU 1566]|uniref:hypothetical protein n=1 Tax=Microbulbifer sp. CAU 1566 TaxID=2933269 RepID=UPI002004ED9C|nr:hypothetical protein [Microbulbifer sp. CAU 1566]MCK7598553.1 hypothetical protein [Microbulbifer sp. CAU 1566]
MLKFRPVKLIGFVLSMLLVFQSALACYDGHGELQATAEHLPAGHQDAADGTPHLDHPQHNGHSPQELQLSQEEFPQLLQLEPAEHDSPDIAQNCNHCCHCHSSISLCLPISFYSPALGFGHQWFAAADAGLPHGFISTLYRPPIA